MALEYRVATDRCRVFSTGDEHVESGGMNGARGFLGTWGFSVGTLRCFFNLEVSRNAHLGFYDEQEAAIKGGVWCWNLYVILKAGLMKHDETVF